MSTTTPLPADILQRIARGDSTAYESLYREMAPRLCAYITRYLHDSAQAADLTQQLFLDLWIDRGTWKVTSGGLRAYLFRSARNRALNARRRHRIEDDWHDGVHADPDLAHSLARSPEPADVKVIRLEDEHSLQRALDTLPERCRMAMHLRWKEGLSYAEVAEVMEITEKGVEKLLGRGMAALRTAIG